MATVLPFTQAHLIQLVTPADNETDSDLHGTLEKLRLDQWPPTYLQKFRSIPKSTLLTLDCAFYRVYVKQSTIPGAGLGLFALCELPKGFTCGWYNGIPVRGDFLAFAERQSTSSSTEVYGKDGFFCTLERYKTYAVNLHEDLDLDVEMSCAASSTRPTGRRQSDFLSRASRSKTTAEASVSALPVAQRGQSSLVHSEAQDRVIQGIVRIVPPEYCCAAYANDPTPRNISLESPIARASSSAAVSTGTPTRRANVVMIPLAKPRTIRNITDYEYIRLETMRDIQKDEELFLNYGSGYWGRQSANQREANKRLIA